VDGSPTGVGLVTAGFGPALPAAEGLPSADGSVVGSNFEP
jgi:hypothetical protein